MSQLCANKKEQQQMLITLWKWNKEQKGNLLTNNKHI